MDVVDRDKVMQTHMEVAACCENTNARWLAVLSCREKTPFIVKLYLSYLGGT